MFMVWNVSTKFYCWHRLSK